MGTIYCAPRTDISRIIAAYYNYVPFEYNNNIRALYISITIIIVIVIIIEYTRFPAIYDYRF